MTEIAHQEPTDPEVDETQTESPKKGGGCLTGVLLLLLSLLGGGSFLGYHLAVSRISWGAVEQKVATEYPDVPSLNVDELKAILDDPSKPQPLLLDAREPKEWAISRLPKARFLGTGTNWMTNVEGVPKSQPIVVYCSVGYRSAVMSDLLLKAGYTDVTNLMGGIFAWANTGKTVYDDNGPTEGVHRFDSGWGRLLKKEYHRR